MNAQLENNPTPEQLKACLMCEEYDLAAEQLGADPCDYAYMERVASIPDPGLTEALAIIEKQQGFLSEIKHISGCLLYGDGTVGSMSPELVRLINSISKQALALTEEGKLWTSCK